MFSISGSGYYRLVRVSNGEYTSLVPWTFDWRVKTGNSAVNRLRIVADGATMTGYVTLRTDQRPAASWANPPSADAGD